MERQNSFSFGISHSILQIILEHSELQQTSWPELSDKSLAGGRFYRHGAQTRIFIPILLHFNQEARRFMAKHYTKCLEDPLGHFIFIKLERDTLCFEICRNFVFCMEILSPYDTANRKIVSIYTIWHTRKRRNTSGWMIFVLKAAVRHFWVKSER